MGERYDIAIRSPVRKLFTYESDIPLLPGARVRLPFRSSEKVGIVWGRSRSDFPDLKKVKTLIDEQPLFDQSALRFYEQASLYYGLALGELLSASVPKRIREGGELASKVEKDFHPELVDLSESQRAVVEGIQSEQELQGHLLFGETGSGKTEVYLHLIQPILEKGGQVLFLVPEISLTPQLEERLSHRLGGSVSSFHSHLSEKKRWQSFSQAAQSASDVFLGARSALFLPYRNLKLIIVDEEHDLSYKQAERMLYHARDLALLRAKQLKIPIVLGSATPSLETYQLSQLGKIRRWDLSRFQKPESWTLEVIDLKKDLKAARGNFISPSLHEAICECLEKKEQGLLFLNRRGSASHRTCLNCGAIDSCRHCSTPMTLHYDTQKAICHLCDDHRPLSSSCSSCESLDFFFGGVGTKEIEEQIRDRFPDARVARLDRDVTRSKLALPKIIKDFSEGRIDLLVGTQMISKGIDIEKLSLVGVIFADQGWGVPDFRAMERSFQLLQQIIGRAGRRGQATRCLIQSLQPENPLFEFLTDGRTEDFLRQELKLREMAELPPFSKAILWTLTHRDPKFLEEAGTAFVQRISPVAKSLGIQLMGPVFAPIERIKRDYRMQVFAKTTRKPSLTTFLQAVLDDMERRPLNVKIRTERDPYYFQ
ncbi:MAG: primosomal protein N' [Bradymonadales bacterium]|nr:MAG: primosomal protein N' [Bradymonadales bacterium]